MKTKHNYKSKVFEAIHRSANALFEIGAIDKIAMHDFDVSCLVTIPITSVKKKRKPLKK